MSDPERLLKSRAADPALRELLGSLRELEPEPRAGLQSWGAMAAKVAALPTLVPPPPPSPLVPLAAEGASHVARSLASTVGAKVGAVLVISALFGAAAYWYRAASRAPNPALNPAHAAIASASAPSVVLPASASVAVGRAPLLAPSLASTTPSPAFSGARLSRLDAEASLVATVRRQLRGGDPRAALSTLTQLQNQFPSGELRQERDVLTVEALAASGNQAAAKSKASAFIAAHPGSPLSTKLQRLVAAQ